MCHYLKMDPWFRQGNHKDITFSMFYAFSENYVLPLSHDEVVHMKGSVFGKMPGDEWQKMAGVRGFYAYTMAHPGKKLSFMGVELGTEEEWAFYKSLSWGLLANQENRQLHEFIRDLNQFYQRHSTLWEIDFDWGGFEWLVPDDNQNNVVVFLRRNKAGDELLCAVNFSANTYENYRFGCPQVREYVEVFNSDDSKYGGAGHLNSAPCKVEWVPSHGKEASVAITIPPLGAVFLEGKGKLRAKAKAKTESSEGDASAPKPRARRKKADAPAEAVPAETAAEEAPKRRGRKKKVEEPAEAAPVAAAAEEAPKRRGRKKKVETPAEVVPVAAASEEAPKRRGRKKKVEEPAEAAAPAPKKRGRPKKTS
jgi:1,4-alpha-glucan branching enzyme